MQNGVSSTRLGRKSPLTGCGTIDRNTDCCFKLLGIVYDEATVP